MALSLFRRFANPSGKSGIITHWALELTPQIRYADTLGSTLLGTRSSRDPRFAHEGSKVILIVKQSAGSLTRGAACYRSKSIDLTRFYGFKLVNVCADVPVEPIARSDTPQQCTRSFSLSRVY